eukprot:Opistho-1_new@55780
MGNVRVAVGPHDFCELHRRRPLPVGHGRFSGDLVALVVEHEAVKVVNDDGHLHLLAPRRREQPPRKLAEREHGLVRHLDAVRKVRPEVGYQPRDHVRQRPALPADPRRVIEDERRALALRWCRGFPPRFLWRRREAAYEVEVDRRWSLALGEPRKVPPHPRRKHSRLAHSPAAAHRDDRRALVVLRRLRSSRDDDGRVWRGRHVPKVHRLDSRESAVNLIEHVQHAVVRRRHEALAVEKHHAVQLGRGRGHDGQPRRRRLPLGYCQAPAHGVVDGVRVGKQARRALARPQNARRRAVPLRVAHLRLAKRRAEERLEIARARLRRWVLEYDGTGGAGRVLRPHVLCVDT